MLTRSLKKPSLPWSVQPNLLGYEKTCAGFHWDDVRRELDWLPDASGLNIAHEAVDRHTKGPEGERLALRWLGSDGTVRDFSYIELKRQSSRFANVLRNLRLGRGDTVCVLSGRIPELYITALGTLKNTSVFCPLFSAFGPEPVYQRLSRGDARVLVTTERQYRQKVAQLMDLLPKLRYVLLADVEDHLEEGLLSLPS